MPNERDEAQVRKIAFSYIRMSTKEQLRGDSRRRQLERSKEYAKKKGYEFKNTIEDIGVSAYRGKNFEDGELGRFIQAAKDGQFDPSNVVLLIESFDRFSRDDPFSAFGKLSEFISTGITIETIMDGQDYSRQSMGNDIGKLYTAVGVLYRAHDESKTKSDRLKESWEKKRKIIAEKPYTGRTPAWLKLNKTTREIVPLEQPTKTILKIFELAIDEDMGAASIARFLNENKEDYPKFTKPEIRNRNKTRGATPGWHESYVKKILNNKAVYGFFQPHKMVDGKQVPAGPEIPDYYPAIMDKERFDLAKSKMSKRKKSGSGRKGEKFSNIFTRLIECGSCGGAIRFIDKGNPPKGGQYLICNNSYNKNECSSPAWRYSDFEEEFVNEVVELPLDELLVSINDPHIRTKLINDISSLKQRIKEIEIDHKNTRDQIRKAKRGGDTLSLRGFEDDLAELSESYSTSKSLLGDKESALASLESRLKRRTKDELTELYKNMKEASDGSDLISLRRKMNSLIRSVVKKIVIYNDFSSVPVWETLDSDLPKSLIDELYAKGYESDSQKEAFFDSDYGRRIFNESLREIRIYFEGGGVRVCRPAKNRSYKIERKIRRFIQNDKKRSAEKLRKYKKKSQVQYDLGESLTKELNVLEWAGDIDGLQSRIDSLSEREKEAISYFNDKSEESGE